MSKNVYVTTLGDFLRSMATRKGSFDPVPDPYPYLDYKEKSALIDTEIDNLLRETLYLERECKTDLQFAGGTRASARVRRAKAHLETLIRLMPVFSNSHSIEEVMHFHSLVKTTEHALKQAKDSLAKHNSQPRKFVAYDVETGEPLNKPDYSNIDVAELVRSFQETLFMCTPPMNRAQRRKAKRNGTIH